jgi:hypothetical protein
MPLEQYDFTIQHWKGSEMAITDRLSRLIVTLDVKVTDDWYSDLTEKIEKKPENYWRRIRLKLVAELSKY